MAVDSGQKVGMVFGELVHGEVNVRIWIHPDYRKKGYGTAALRKSRLRDGVVFPRRAVGYPDAAGQARLSRLTRLSQSRRYVLDIAERDHGRLVRGNSKPLSA